MLNSHKNCFRVANALFICLSVSVLFAGTAAAQARGSIQPLSMNLGLSDSFSPGPGGSRTPAWAGALGLGAAYTLASFTALGRMEENRHFLGDALFGAAVGLTCGSEVSRGSGLRSSLYKFNLAPHSVSFEHHF